MLSRRRCERGQDLVEYALILPFLLLLLFGIVEFALIVFSYNTIVDAARQGARYGVIGIRADTPTGIQAIEDEAYKVTAAAGLPRGLNGAVATATKTGDTIRVEVTYTMNAGVFANLIHWLTRGRVSGILLRAVSTKQIELE
jgi:Flp pilus assembly protein TadG